MNSTLMIEGTPQELVDKLKGFSRTLRLTLVVPGQVEQDEMPQNLHHGTPEERSRALDEIAGMNRGIPALPPEAFSRENLYEEDV